MSKTTFSLPSLDEETLSQLTSYARSQKGKHRLGLGTHRSIAMPIVRELFTWRVSAPRVGPQYSQQAIADQTGISQSWGSEI